MTATANDAEEEDARGPAGENVRESGDDGAENGEEDPEENGGKDPESTETDVPKWLSTYWLESRVARVLVLSDVLLTAILAIAVAVLFHDPALSAVAEAMPWIDGGQADAGAMGNGASGAGFEATPTSAFVFALLGALGYVFTVLLTDLHRDAAKVVQANFRVIAAIPLAAGVFLLSDYILGDAGVGTLGFVFLTGLYVNLVYERLGGIADHFLPAEDEGDGNPERPG